MRPDQREPERHDWQKIVADIKAGYFELEGKELSDYKLALWIGADTNAITRLCERKNAQPSHYNGEQLLSFHRRYRKLSGKLSPSAHCASDNKRLG